MSAAWVAGSIRGRLLTRRRLGEVGARAVAASGSTDAAVADLASSVYGRDVHVGMSVAPARRAIGSVCMWHLRVLAGWQPPRAGDVVRVFAGRFEMANIGDRLVALSGEPVAEPYALGALSVAWPRVAVATTTADVRDALTGSVWGDPGETDWAAVAPVLEARWTSWLAGAVPDASSWAAGAAAMVVARRLASDQAVPAAAVMDLRRQLGRGWETATDVADLVARLPSAAVWVLDGVDAPDELWRAEGRWWHRVDQDAARVLRTGRPGPAVAAAAAARLMADAWRAQAALEAAPWGGEGIEAFDAVA